MALRHILCRGPFHHDRINLNLVGAPNFRGPLVLELTLTTVRYATVCVPEFVEAQIPKM